MLVPNFPETKVTDHLDKLAKNHGLEFIDVRFTPGEQLSPNFGENIQGQWTWVLIKPGGYVHLVIAILYPNLIPMVGITNKLSMPGNGTPVEFGFREYLDKYTRDYESSRRLHQLFNEESWESCWLEYLAILDKHLEYELGEVMNGEWSFVNYRELDSLLYDQQVKLIDDLSKNKKQGGWVYFLDYFRKK